jgi:hypothetical protein
MTKESNTMNEYQYHFLYADDYNREASNEMQQLEKRTATGSPMDLPIGLQPIRNKI